MKLQDRFFNSIVIKYLFDAYVRNKEYLQAIKVYLDAFFVSKVMVRKIDYKKALCCYEKAELLGCEVKADIVRVKEILNFIKNF